MSWWGQKEWKRNKKSDEKEKAVERDLQIALIKAVNLLEKKKKHVWFGK